MDETDRISIGRQPGGCQAAISVLLCVTSAKKRLYLWIAHEEIFKQDEL